MQHTSTTNNKQNICRTEALDHNEPLHLDLQSAVHVLYDRSHLDDPQRHFWVLDDPFFNSGHASVHTHRFVRPGPHSQKALLRAPPQGLFECLPPT